MFKPLLRIMPSLSGNVKLAGYVNDIKEIEEDVYESYVRVAQLMPLTSSLFTKWMPISLLTSSYEWDIMVFYRMYPQYFYNKMFDYNKYDIKKFNYFALNTNRNSDFEFGVKRVSYSKSLGKQFAFFAPIYIESENDIPDEFRIKINIKNSLYEQTKTLIVKIGANLDDDKNYLGNYVKSYSKKIDDNVVFLSPSTGHAMYYGINVENGGFNILKDVDIDSIFTYQNTITNFDNIINKGFERHKMIIRQVLPLCFYFNVNDLMSDLEIDQFYDSKMTINGSYFKDGYEVLLHDFEHDYTFYQPKTLQMNTDDGSEGFYFNYPLANIMNIGYPSLRESLFYKYRFTNKVSPNFCRWMLKYSDDEHPYITNMSPAFSMYQHSYNLYKEFPRTYSNVTALLGKHNFKLNLVYPFGEGAKWYTENAVKRYRNIRDRFAGSWFDIYDNFDDLFNKCVDVNADGKCMYRGILYNFNDIYNQSAEKLPKIDKFGVFIMPTFIPVTEDEISNELYYSNYTVFRQNGKYLNAPNCVVNDNALISNDYELFSSIYSNIKSDEIAHNEIFTYNENNNGEFIDLRYYDIDWYELNKFYRFDDIKSYIGRHFWDKLERKCIDGYDLVPIYRTSNISNQFRFGDVTTASDLYYSSGNSAIIPIEKDVRVPISYSPYEYPLYRKDKFISYQDLFTYMNRFIFSYNSVKYRENRSSAYQHNLATTQTYQILDSIDNSEMITYQFHPILTQLSGEIYGTKIFKANDYGCPRFYGDEIKYEDYDKDIDFLYVDTYNYNNIVDHYNNYWLKNKPENEKLSYVTSLNSDVTDPIFEEMWKTSMDNKENQSKIFKDFLNDHIRYAGPKLIAEDTFIKVYELYNIDAENSITKKLEDKRKTYEETLDITPEDIQEGLEYFAQLYYSIDISNTHKNDIINDSITWKNCIEFIYMKHNYPVEYFNGWKWNVLDDFSSNTAYTKFLNLLHVKYFLKTLHQNFENKLRRYDSINDIYVRRRILLKDNTVRDIYNKFTDVFYIPKEMDELLEAIYEELQYDKKENLFYFKHIERKFNAVRDKDGLLYATHYVVSNKFGSKAVKPGIFQHYTTCYDENGNFDPTKLKFELVFKRNLMKANDDVYNLINLEEKYASPYKDLYLYELETDIEYNPLLTIYEGEIVGDTDKYRKVMKPMFNLVEIEAKDKTKIYTEYSVHGLTRSHIENPFDKTQEYHFYRHNKNNTNIMFDLSWLNRDVPIEIRGKKYIYAYSYLAEYNEETQYSYFHHTFDKYKNNSVDFVNYSYYTVSSVLESIEPVYEIQRIPVVAYRSAESFSLEFPEIYKKLNEGNLMTASYNDAFWKSINPNTLNTTFSYLYHEDIPRIVDYSYNYKDIATYYTSDDLKLFDNYNLNTYVYEENGEEKVAAFYILNVFFNNSINAMMVNTYSGEYCKYLSYINGVNIQDDPDYTHYNYKRLMPFIRNYPLNKFLEGASTVCYPEIHNIKREYEPEPHYKRHHKLSYYDIKEIEFASEYNVLERYFDQIKPVITQKSNINTYMLKFKDSDASFKPAYFTNEVIYNQEISVNRYPGIRVYHLNEKDQKNSTYKYVKDIEYKFYNDNHYINLQEEMEYKYTKPLTKLELMIAQLDSEVLEKFKETILRNHELTTLTDSEMEWAYTKYEKSFETVSNELDLDVENKLYELTIKFKLY